MRNVKLTIAYDGTGLVGWQRQAEGTSVQGLLEDALKPIEGAAVTVQGAGRTDAGAHALAQVANVRLTARLDDETIARAVNAVLPSAVRVVRVEEAPPDFHARFSATGKVYRYRLLNGGPGSPFDQRYAWFVPQPLDFDAMAAAIEPLRGTHDFSAFAAAGSPVHTAERTIDDIRLNRGFPPWHARGALIALDIRGSGFLRHMVRNVMGTLVEIGAGRWTPDTVGEILASRDRSRAGVTAPPHGLFLVEVLY